jgi:hypothetical protein
VRGKRKKLSGKRKGTEGRYSRDGRERTKGRKKM